MSSVVPFNWILLIVFIIGAHAIGVLTLQLTVAAIDAIQGKGHSKEPSDPRPQGSVNKIKEVDGHEYRYTQIEQHHEKAEE